jgi:hypothetical protein
MIDRNMYRICAILSTVAIPACSGGEDAAGQQQERDGYAVSASAVPPSAATADTFLAFTIRGDGHAEERVVASKPQVVATYMRPMAQHGMTAISAHGEWRDGLITLDAKPGLLTAGRYEFQRHPDEEVVDNFWITIRPSGEAAAIYYYLVDGDITIVDYGSPAAPGTGSFSGRFVKAMRPGAIDLVANPDAPREYVSISNGYFRVPHSTR